MDLVLAVRPTGRAAGCDHVPRTRFVAERIAGCSSPAGGGGRGPAKPGVPERSPRATATKPPQPAGSGHVLSSELSSLDSRPPRAQIVDG